MLEAINPIEACYRKLVQEGRGIEKLYSGNPNDHGIQFPGEILERSYSHYFKNQFYQPVAKGLKIARDAITQFYLEKKVELDPEHILLTSGTSESFFYLFSLLAQPGDNLLVPNPAYPLFDEIARLSHLELRQYRLDEENDWRIDMQSMDAMANSKTRAVLLVSPNNPTGAVHSREELEAVVAWANQKNIPLICDEVFSEFYFGEGEFPRAIAVAKPKLCFTLNGISKMLALPAMKCSWIAVSGDSTAVTPAVDQLETMIDTFLTCHTPIQQALPILFEEGKVFLQQYQKEVRLRRDTALTALKEMKRIECIDPKGSFYLMLRLKGMECNEEELVISLMREKSIFFHPGYFYDEESGVHLVMSFLSKPEILKDSIGKLGEWIG